MISHAQPVNQPILFSLQAFAQIKLNIEPSNNPFIYPFLCYINMAYREKNLKKHPLIQCTCWKGPKRCLSRKNCHSCICLVSKEFSIDCLAFFHKCTCLVDVHRCRLNSKDRLDKNKVRHHCSCMENRKECLATDHKCVCIDGLDPNCGATNHRTKRRKISEV